MARNSAAMHLSRRPHNIQNSIEFQLLQVFANGRRRARAGYITPARSVNSRVVAMETDAKRLTTDIR